MIHDPHRYEASSENSWTIVQSSIINKRNRLNVGMEYGRKRTKRQAGCQVKGEPEKKSEVEKLDGRKEKQDNRKEKKKRQIRKIY